MALLLSWQARPAEFDPQGLLRAKLFPFVAKVEAITGLTSFNSLVFSDVGANAFEFNVAAVPETSTWIMMILGFAGVGFFAYRKKGALQFA